jgi:hypothetical protein
MCKEVTIVLFAVLSRQLHGQPEKRHEILNQDNLLLT